MSETKSLSERLQELIEETKELERIMTQSQLITPLAGLEKPANTKE